MRQTLNNILKILFKIDFIIDNNYKYKLWNIFIQII